jgi:SHS2 domain-containing protein
MYRWVDHTGELELEIEAVSEADVFVDAGQALCELLAGGEPVGEPARRTVRAQADDRATQLADWLEELVYLAEVHGFVPGRVAAVELAADRVSATVDGRLGSPPHLVKAVTYHGLSFASSGEGWRATVVFDV